MGELFFACDLLPNPAKLPTYSALRYSYEQIFYADDEKIHRLKF
jgi:hypothetical protein